MMMNKNDVRKQVEESNYEARRKKRIIVLICRFKCGLCVMKDVVEVRNENENLKRQMEQMKNEDDKRKEAGVHEKNENVNTWATIAKRLTNEKTIEKLE